MNQSKLASFYEALANTLVGYFLSLAVQLIVYPMFGARFTLGDNLLIGLIFLVVSLVRGYVLRRWFNAKLHAAARRLAGDKGSS
jgi:putative flippase GtrA